MPTAPIPRRPQRPGRAALGPLIFASLLLAGCAAPAQRIELSPEQTVKAAQRLLTDRCLIRQGLTPPRPGSPTPRPDDARRVADALFGTGPAELSLTLPSGHVIRQHTDGCLAAAQRQLYGDQQRWFRASTTVGNLHSAAPAAQHADYRRLHALALDRSRTLLTHTASTPQRKSTHP
ncbi:hypothetical protein [Streptomyces sp. NPDC000410]|uniref:hypothetical protein n=1 Tax=Streptomyces sp. NPDC000410 TaxID=3154254 RepID=UPI00331845C7